MITTILIYLWVCCGAFSIVIDAVDDHLYHTNYGVHPDWNGKFLSYYGYFFHGFFSVCAGPIFLIRRIPLIQTMAGWHE